jgi:predicted ATP-grasp superfamily ATP-dependent carboligase
VNQPIAIVGASTRAAAVSAKRAGFQPVAADLFADADLRAIATTTRISPYPEGFVDWLRAIEPPAWMYTGALENHPELVDQLAWIAPLWGNPGDVLERVRSPWELAATLRAAGLLFPETRVTSDGLPSDGSWLAKTYHGASGSGVREWNQRERGGEGETGKHHPLTVSSLSPSLCFQRRILGTAASAVFVGADGAAALLGITRQLIGEPWLGAHGFQYAGSIGPLPVDEATRATTDKIGHVLSAQFELSGLFGVDMMINAEGVWTIEVNPRYTASVEVLERATGIHAIRLHADACTESLEGSERAGASSPPSVSPPHGGEDAPARAYGKAILYAKRDVALNREFVDRAFAESQVSPWPSLADISAANDAVEAGRPILTIFAEGETDGLVERRLRERVVQLEHQIYGGDLP